MTLGPVAKWLLRAGTALTLVFVYTPIVVGTAATPRRTPGGTG